MIGYCTGTIVASGRETGGMPQGRYHVRVHFGLTIAVAGGVVLGIFAGLTMLVTVFFHRHQRRMMFAGVRRRGCTDRKAELPLIAAAYSDMSAVRARHLDGQDDTGDESDCTGDLRLYYDCKPAIQCYQCRSRDDWSDAECATASATAPGTVASTACCCCCSARSASSRCCVDYTRLVELQPQSATDRRRSSLMDASLTPSSSDSRRRSSVRICLDVQRSPTRHDDDVEELILGDVCGHSSSTNRPTLVRLTTFKPAEQQVPTSDRSKDKTEAEVVGGGVASTDDGDRKTSDGAEEQTAAMKQRSTSSTVTSSTSAVSSSVSAALERLRPDLLPLMSSAAEDLAVITSLIRRPDDLQ